MERTCRSVCLLSMAWFLYVVGRAVAHWLTQEPPDDEGIADNPAAGSATGAVFRSAHGAQ